MMRTLADAYHAERCAAAAAAGEPEPEYEDTAFGLRLAASALVGEAMISPLLTRSAGLDDAAAARFRKWLAQLLND